MNSTLTTRPSRHEHPPSVERHEHVVRRVSLIDRLALHAGLALIKWGRRPLALETRERRAGRVEQQLARIERERAAERSWLLTAPPR